MESNWTTGPELRVMREYLIVSHLTSVAQLTCINSILSHQVAILHGIVNILAASRVPHA